MTIEELQARVAAAEPNGMLKVNINHGEHGNEGIWACFATPDAKAVYDRNTSGETFEVFLMNNALMGMPSWGARLKVTTDGVHRPVISEDSLLEQLDAAVDAGEYPTAADFAETANAD